MSIEEDYDISEMWTETLRDSRHVFVFGSNLAGRHGVGTALLAKRHWGAEPGIGVGRQGMSYAIPTKDERLQVLSIRRIQAFVHEFKIYARNHPKLIFLVVKIGCGFSGYTEEAIAPMFFDAPANCVLPDGWR